MAEVVESAAVGELCDPTSPASIADAIRRVLARSPGERAAHRAHVLQVAHERYNWENQLGTLFDLYTDLGYPPVE
jgi:glycosyltransferase involved in cell wall biosynthesis